jgi:serine/threonine protein kinase
MCSLDSISNASTIDISFLEPQIEPLNQDISHIVHSMILNIFSDNDILLGLRDDFSSLENKNVSVLCQLEHEEEKEVSDKSHSSFNLVQQASSGSSKAICDDGADTLEFIKGLFNNVIMQAFEKAVERFECSNEKAKGQSTSCLHLLSEESIDQQTSSLFTAALVSKNTKDLVPLEKNEEKSETNAPSHQIATSITVRPDADRLVVKLTSGLLDTYKRINEAYYARKKACQLLKASSATTSTTSCASSLAKQATKDVEVPSILTGKAISTTIGDLSFRNLMGKGSYGEVYSGTFRPKKSAEIIQVALKVNLIFQAHSDTEYLKNSLIKEAEALKAISSVVPSHSTSFAKCLGICQLDPKRFCLIQPLYGMNLYQVQLRNNGACFSFNLIYEFAHQLFISLNLLRQPEVNLIHFDLKPENILLDTAASHKIRIIDLGSSMKADETQGCKDYLVSRFYRAPEIVLKLAYTNAVDVWSVGCILFELYAGKPLFPAQNSSELLMMIYELVGPLPASVVEKIPSYKKIFSPEEKKPGFYKFSRPLERDGRFEDRRAYFERKLNYANRCRDVFQASVQKNYLSQEIIDQFKDLILSMLSWDASCRPGPLALLEHPFMKTISELNTKEHKVSTARSQ